MAAALEKDAELDRRIAALRRKNEALVRRYQEIEEDRRRAELEGGAVTARPLPRRGGDRDPPPGPPADKRPPKDKKPPGPPKISGRPPRGGGGGGGASGGPPGPFFGGGSRARRPRGRGGGAGGGEPGPDRKAQEWEQRRLQNIEQMNEEMEKIAEYERSRREGVPEKNPERNFLDDPRRCGPAHGGEGPGRGPAHRHARNWGGPHFGKATARHSSPKVGRGPPLDPTLWMTGRERAEYERWKRERDRIDRERLERHRDPRGAWRREWDAQKPPQMFSGVPEGPEEGGGDPKRPPPQNPNFGGFPALPHPPRRRRGRGRGGRPYRMHDDRWDPEPSEDPKTLQALENPLEKAPEPAWNSQSEDEDQWEDLEEEEEEPGEPPRLTPPDPPSPPQCEGGGQNPQTGTEPEASGTHPEGVSGVEIADFQRVRFRKSQSPPKTPQNQPETPP